MSTGPQPRTAAANAARRAATEAKVQRVRDGIAQLRRHKQPVTYPAVALRATVSRTFLYENPDARALVTGAIAAGSAQPPRPPPPTPSMRRPGGNVPSTPRPR